MQKRHCGSTTKRDPRVALLEQWQFEAIADQPELTEISLEFSTSSTWTFTYNFKRFNRKAVLQVIFSPQFPFEPPSMVWLPTLEESFRILIPASRSRAFLLESSRVSLTTFWSGRDSTWRDFKEIILQLKDKLLELLNNMVEKNKAVKELDAAISCYTDALILEADNPESMTRDAALKSLFALRSRYPFVANTIATLFAQYECGILRPLVLLFAGPSGVGKTQMAEQLARCLHPQLSLKTQQDQGLYRRFDMAHFMEEVSYTNLFGSSKGYQGHEEGGELVNFLTHAAGKGCLVLFDEIEKAHPSILSALLSLFDKPGSVRGTNGALADATNAVFLLTTNHSRDEVCTIVSQMEHQGTAGAQCQDIPPAANKRVLESLQKEEMCGGKKVRFTKEFLGRVETCGGVIPFPPLHITDQAVICRYQLLSLRAKLSKEGLRLVWPESLPQLVVNQLDQSIVADMGARAVQQATRSFLKSLKYPLQQGSDIVLTFDPVTGTVVPNTTISLDPLAPLQANSKKSERVVSRLRVLLLSEAHEDVVTPLDLPALTWDGLTEQVRSHLSLPPTEHFTIHYKSDQFWVDAKGKITQIPHNAVIRVVRSSMAKQSVSSSADTVFVAVTVIGLALVAVLLMYLI